MKSYPVTIIVPIYNVEKYIERCAVSLFEQDFDDIEYIFVNDCTPDNSMQILKSVLERYPNRQSHAKIINHKINKGLGYTRKTGLKEASGEYIIHIDSDDWVELDMISSMYKEAKSKDLDILIANYYIEEKNNTTTHVKIFTDKNVPVENLFKNILSGRFDYNTVWNKLVKRKLYIENNISPPENISNNEDSYLVTRLFYFAKRVGFIDRAFYHYIRTNPSSITYIRYTKKNLEELKIYIEDTEKFLHDQKIYQNYKECFSSLIMVYYKTFYDVKDGFLYNYKPLIKISYIFKSKNYSFKRKIKIYLFHLKMKFKYLFNK